ncbi:alpha/beta fold hydrolase [Streptomyces eurythermus]|uniref:alpha/beta fold hydrolase n=1 Tax=Streptomyces eurythermus TaxID=42237 RepID=UPI0036F7B8F4
MIAFGDRGVGASGGSAPDTIEAMARDAVLFIRAPGFGQAGLPGLSMGGFIAQLSAAEEPQLVRRLVLAGAGRAAGRGIDKGTALTLRATLRGSKAIHRWGLQPPADLCGIRQPAMVANGESDRMVPGENTLDLAARLRHPELARTLAFLEARPGARPLVPHPPPPPSRRGRDETDPGEPARPRSDALPPAGGCAAFVRLAGRGSHPFGRFRPAERIGARPASVV